LPFLAHDFRGNGLAHNGVRHKNGFTLFTSHAFSAEGNIFDFQIDDAHAPTREKHP